MSRKAQGITLITLIVTVVALMVGNLANGAPAHADPGGFTPVQSTFPTGSSWTVIQGTAPDSTADPSATDVPLITGDVVHLTADGDVAGVTPGQRPDGSITQYSVVTSQTQTYVIPADVSSLVGDQLDRELFNVTKLASYDLNADSSIPVIVTHPETVEAATVTKKISTMGVSIKSTLDPMPIQAGEADATSTDGPAPTWTLIDNLDKEATSPTDPVSSDTKVWLDQKIQLSPMSVTPMATTPTPAWMATIGADVAKSEGFDGTGIKVAVIDSGMDANHPDLAGQIIASKDFTGSGSTSDPVGHGTFVASEIAGTGKASNGQYAGVAPGAKLINARVIDRTGGGYDSDMMSGLQWAAQQGANIVNMSLGDYTTMDDGTSVLSQFVNQIARQYGCLIVVAAGNEGAPQTVSTPATADEALSVGATLQDGTLAWFSSTGPRRGDGAVNPQIMAPGAGTVTLDRNGNPVRDRYGDPQTSGLVAAGSGTTGYISDGYFGTSMAAPLVAGAAALVAQADPGLNRTGIKASLMAGASPLPDGSDPFQQGAGLLNIPAAIHAPVTTSPSQLNFGTVTSSLPAQTTRTLTYTNTSSQAETFALSSSLSFTTSRGAPTSGYSASSSTATVSGTGGTSSNVSVSISAPATSDQILLSTDTITVPASGSASITVTINPAAFSAGYVGGYVIATSPDTTLRTPLGWANQSKMYTLTITANDKDGALGDPAKGDVTLVNMDTGATQVVSPVTSRMTASVVGGHYVAVASLTKANTLDGTDATLVESPVLTISSNTSVTLDGRTAQPADVQTDLPTADGQPNLVLSATSPSLSYKYARFVTSDRGVLSTDRVFVTPVSDSAWQLSSLAWLPEPTLEASAQACGTSTLPVESAGATLPAGQYAWTLTPASSLPLPSASGKAAVLARWGTGLTASTARQWADAARSSGYAALIIATDTATATRSSLADALGTQPSLPVLVTTTAAADQLSPADGTATMNVLSRTQPAYYYLLAKDFSLSQNQPYTLSGSAATTAAVTVQHRAMTANPSWTDVFTYRPGSGNGVITGGGFTLATVASSYVAHVSADLTWTASSVSPGMANLALAQSVVPARLYRAGDSSTITFGTQVHSAALSPDQPMVRTADTLRAGIPGYVDGLGLFDTGRQAYPADFGTSSLTLKNLTTAASIPLTLDAATQTVSASVPSTSQSFELDQATVTSPGYWALSGSVNTQWTWQSQTTSGATTQPLLQVWYELPDLDANNAGSPKQTVVVHVGQQAGSAALSLGQVSLQASTNNGNAWTDVPLQAASGADSGAASASYTGTIAASNGATVSLKSSVQAGTSGFAQTVTNAYTVTTSPQEFAQPVVWSCQTKAPGLVVTANATQIAGTSSPSTAVWVLDSNGNTLGQVTTDADGAWAIDTPAGLVSQTISLATLDDQGTATILATAHLDTDIPSPARVDQANASTVSGGPGAVPPSAVVSVAFPGGANGSGIAGEDGSFTVATPAGVPSGEMTLTVWSAAGNQSQPVSYWVNFTSVADMTVDTANATQIAGTGRPGTTVVISDAQGAELGSAQTGADGTWSVAVPPGTPSQPITATVDDQFGNSASVEASLEADAPASPSVERANASVVSGTADPGSTVRVTFPDQSSLETTAGPDGSYSVATPAGMASGEISVAAVNATGNASQATTASLDTQTPQVAVIVTANGQVIEGTAEAGALVTILYPDGTDTEVLADQDGAFSLATPSGMPTGNIVVTVTDAAGNLSQPVTMHLDTQAPQAARVDRANATEVSGGQGAAEAGSVVAVTFPDGSVLSTQPNANGSYTVTTPAGMVSGQASVSVTDQAGNVSTPTAFDLDTVAPSAPRVDLADRTTVSGDAGAAEPGSTVTAVFPNGTTQASTTAGADGSYAIPTPAGVMAGTISVTATDAAGNDSPATQADLTTGPGTLVVTTANATEISGTADPGKTVQVTDGQGQVLGTADVAPDGTWTIATPAGTAPGPVTVSVTNASGTMLESTSVDLDTQAPSAVVITGANASHVSGHAEPGSTVVVSFPGSTSGQASGTDPADQVLVPVQVDSDGVFTVATPAGTPSGTLSAIAVDAAGNQSIPTKAFLDTLPPAPAQVDRANATGISGDLGAVEANATVTVTFPDGTTTSAGANADGSYVVSTPAGMVSGEITVVVTDTAGNVSTPVTMVLDTVAPQAPEVDTTNGSQVSGWAEPGSMITVTNTDGVAVPGCATVLAGADGFFSCVPSPALTTSATALVTATDPAGNTSLAVTVPVVDEGAIPATPVVVTANASTIAGTAPAGTTVVVGYQTADGPRPVQTQADVAGAWAITTPDDAIDGPIAVAAIDADQRTSQLAQAILDRTAPDAPVVQVADDVQISGTAEAGSWVQISYADGTALADTIADTDGVWLVPTPDNAHTSTISVITTDAAGNQSQATVVPLTIPAPAPPVISSPVDGTVMSGTSVSLAGTGITGATVTVADSDGSTVCTALVDTNRTWNCSGTLGDATHVLTATQVVTGAGQSPASPAVSVTVTTQPAQPPTTPAQPPSDTASSTPGGTGTPTSTSTPAGTASTAPTSGTTPATSPTAPTTSAAPTTPAAPRTTAGPSTPAGPATTAAAPSTTPAAPSRTPAAPPTTPATPPASPTTSAPATAHQTTAPATAAPSTRPAMTPTTGPSSPATTPARQPGSPTTTPALTPTTTTSGSTAPTPGPGVSTMPAAGSSTTAGTPTTSTSTPTATTTGSTALAPDPGSASTASGANPGHQVGTPGTSQASGSDNAPVPTGGTAHTWPSAWPIAVFLLTTSLLFAVVTPWIIKRRRGLVHIDERSNS